MRETQQHPFGAEGWVSITNRLPETETTVLICYGGSRHIAKRDIIGTWRHAHSYSELISQEEVTHWMPLPEPPRSKHAALKALYAQDAQERDRPWERWQWAYLNSDTWFDCKAPVVFYEQREYRRKPVEPRTMTIAGIEVPMPMTEMPKRGETFFYPAFHNGNAAANLSVYTDTEVDRGIFLPLLKFKWVVGHEG